MKREIKFRVWDKKYGEWLLPNSYGVLVHNGEIQLPEMYGGSGDYELMQFTGLKDKNGKEIYEGDILGDEGEVVWVEQSASFRVNPSRKNKDISFTESFLNIDNPEIIGNIYENPELISPKA